MKTTRFPFVFGDSAVLFIAKKWQTLVEYNEKTVRGAMGCDVLETNYNYSGSTVIRFSLIENSIVLEQEMVNYVHCNS